MVQTQIYVWRALTYIVLISLFLGTALAFPHLPDVVPQNFRADGSFRGEFPRLFIWSMPLAGLLVFGLLALVRRRSIQRSSFAHVDDNTPKEVKAALRQYIDAQTWFMAAVLTVYFAWAQSIYIAAATDWWAVMPHSSLWMLLVLGIGMFYYIAKILKISQHK